MLGGGCTDESLFDCARQGRHGSAVAYGTRALELRRAALGPRYAGGAHLSLAQVARSGLVRERERERQRISDDGHSNAWIERE